MSDFWQPHELGPARLLCPWDSPGKNTGVGCHSLTSIKLLGCTGKASLKRKCFSPNEGGEGQSLRCLVNGQFRWSTPGSGRDVLFSFYISTCCLDPCQEPVFQETIKFCWPAHGRCSRAVFLKHNLHQDHLEILM